MSAGKPPRIPSTGLPKYEDPATISQAMKIAFEQQQKIQTQRGERAARREAIQKPIEVPIIQEEEKKIEVPEQDYEEEIPRSRRKYQDVSIKPSLRLTAQNEIKTSFNERAIIGYGWIQKPNIVWEGKFLQRFDIMTLSEFRVVNQAVGTMKIAIANMDSGQQYAPENIAFAGQRMTLRIQPMIPYFGNFLEGYNSKQKFEIVRLLNPDHFESITGTAAGNILFNPKVRWIIGGNADEDPQNPRYKAFQPNRFMNEFQELFKEECKPSKIQETLGLDSFSENDEDFVEYRIGDQNIEIPKMDDEQQQFLDIIYRKEILNEGELDHVVYFLNKRPASVVGRTSQIDTGIFLGHLCTSVFKKYGQMTENMFDFIHQLRMESADELKHFKSGFDAAGKANKIKLNETSLRRMPLNMDRISNEDLHDGFTTDLTIRYPFEFLQENPADQRILQVFTTSMLWFLSHYTQYPEIKGVGVISPIQLFFIWKMFALILRISVKSLFLSSADKNYLRPLCKRLGTHLFPQPITVSAYEDDDEFIFLISEPVSVLGEENTHTFERVIISAFKVFVRGYIRLYLQLKPPYTGPENRISLKFDRISTIHQVPVNMNAFNSSFNGASVRPTVLPIFPKHTKFKRAFNEAVEQESNKISLRAYRDEFNNGIRFNRAVDFDVIDIESDSAGRPAMDILRGALAQKVARIYQGLAAYDYNYLDRTIDGWQIFIGLEIVTIRRQSLEHLVELEATDEINEWINSADQRAVRMAHCSVQLSNLGVAGRDSDEFRYFFGNARAYFRNNQPKNIVRRVGLRVEQPDIKNAGRPPPRTMGDICVNDVMADIFEFITNLDEAEALGAFDDTSGPVDQDAQIDFTDAAQFISKITLFSLPIYQNLGQVLPLRAMIKHAPIVFNTVDFKILREHEMHEELNKELLDKNINILDHPLNSYLDFTCLQKSLYFLLTRLNVQQNRWMTIKCYEKARDFQGSAAEMLKTVMDNTNEPGRSTIAIFYTEGCILSFFHESSLTPSIKKFMREKEYDRHPVICIRNQTSEQGLAHIFPTELQHVKNFIKAIGNFQMRKDKNSQKQEHPGYVLYAHPKPNWLPKPLNKDVYREELMKQVWTLDIETLSYPGQPMEPYCIVIWDGVREALNLIAEPKAVVKAFQDFLSDLKQQRSQVKTDDLKDLHIYAHNGSKFDWVILIRSIFRVFPDAQIYGTPTNLKAIIIKSIKVKLLDFILMVPGSLQKIAKSFQVQNQKQQCDDIKEVKIFAALTNTQRLRIVKYCRQDTICLWQCIKAFTQEVIELLNPHYPLPLNKILPITNSSLAQEVFKFKFQSCGNFLGTTDLDIDLIESDAYFGGMTQAFNYHELKDVFYIDVNSLYPYAMTKINVSNLPATAESRRPFVYSLDKKREIQPNFLYKVDYFEFKHYSPGLLPVRCPDGSLCWPLKSSQPCWRTGWEIQALEFSQLLTKLEISECLVYEGVMTNAKPFYDYVTEIYEMKKNAPDEVKKTLYKLLLNQLYGQFAQRAYPSLKLVRSMDLFNDPSLPAKLVREELNASVLCDLMDEKTDLDKLQKLWADSNDFDSKEAKIKFIPVIAGINQVDKDNEFVQITLEQSILNVQRVGMLKRISVMTTGCARAHMIKAFTYIHRAWGPNMMKHIHYMDTDSLFVSQDAYEQLHMMLHEKDLGKFKLEIPCKITKMQVFGNKVYFAVPEQGQTLYKFKGISSKYIKETLQDDFDRRKLFYDIFAEKLPPKTQTEMWKRGFGTVIISEATKQNMSKPRRLILPDGTSKCFQTVQAYLKNAAEYRLVQLRNKSFEYRPIEKSN